MFGYLAHIGQTRTSCILAKKLFEMSSRMWRVKLKWILNKCFVRMWTGLICPTEDEWGISKLQETIQHNQIYFQIIAIAILLKEKT